ncbi:dicarboxylate/amino acid:cation symporter [Olivibacter sitiensis]|uniref:dicarboxylate/amino acid:cation symporter n=1 Tax=Olivibacter sitiensis TaxID=376470 RepID=UPI000411E1ED|nr:dicarboxylate/amino acid:cation symporter [Olivibacter sitiensis]
MTKSNGFFQNYGNIILLLLGIVVGSIVGMFYRDEVVYLKPIGDIFLNLLFTVVIPLIFFAIASAVASIDRGQKLGKLLSVMLLVFFITGALAAASTIGVFALFPVEAPSVVAMEQALEHAESKDWGDQLVGFITVSEFGDLLSRKHMLPFIIFSFFVGLATLQIGEAGTPFRAFLQSGNEVMKRLMVYVMKLAPVGLGAYFAYQVGTVGPQLFGVYAKPLGIYYGYGLVYFIVFFSLYAFIGAGTQGVKLYWKNNILPSLAALSTCSSIAVLPINLDAARKMRIPDAVANVVLPLGTTLHKNGSSISAIVKLVVVFQLMGRDFMQADTIAVAILLAVLVSVVEGGIPNGGYIGELLMISAYNLPLETVPAVMIIGTLVDPMATVLNATGDTAAAMVVARYTKAKS